MGKTQKKQKQLLQDVPHSFPAVSHDLENSVKNAAGGVV